MYLYISTLFVVLLYLLYRIYESYHAVHIINNFQLVTQRWFKSKPDSLEYDTGDGFDANQMFVYVHALGYRVVAVSHLSNMLLVSRDPRDTQRVEPHMPYYEDSVQYNVFVCQNS